MKRKTPLDLTEGPILKKLIWFAIPLFLNSLINQLYSTADTVVMGRFAGPLAMAAVGASGSPMSLLVNLFAGISTGVTVCCGNLKGGRKDKDLADCMHTSLLLSLVVGLLISVIGITFCEPILKYMDTPADIIDKAVLYMRIRLASGPVWMLTAFASGIFHAFGEARIPTIVGIVSGLVNVALNVVFVVCCGMDVDGVAWATNVSLVLKAITLCAILFYPKGQYKLTFSRLRMRWNHTRSILAVGLPTGVSNIIFSVSNVLLQSSVNRFGAMVVAGNTAALELVSYVALALTAMRAACVSATAQCYGAHKFKRMDQIAKIAIFSCAAVMVVLNIFVTIYGKQLMSMIADDPAVGELGFPRLMFNSWGYMLFAVVKVFGGGLTGMRKSTVSLLCDLLGIIFPRILWVWLVVPQMQTPDFIYAIYPITWLITSIMTGAAFYHYLKRLEREQTDTSATVA